MDNYDLQVDKAKKIFLDYDHAMIIRKYALDADENWVYLTYLNTPYRISRTDGTVESFCQKDWQECRDYSTVMTIYDLLCYHKGASLPPLADNWCAVGTFVVAGVTKTETFTGKYAKFFNDRLEELRSACVKMGGVLQTPVAGADLTCKFWVTPFFPVLLQFWNGDEEFTAKLLILWDGNTLQFMHYETTFYLQGDLLERLKNYIK